MGTSITDFLKRIKWPGGASRKDLFTFAVIVLAAAGSFSLGRLSVYSHEPLLIESQASSEVTPKTLASPVGAVTNTAVTKKAAATGTGEVAASKNGTKYFFPWCASANTIKEANKVWFASADAARAAGYMPAANCKGLK